MSRRHKWYYELVVTQRVGGCLYEYRSYYYRYNLNTGYRQYCYRYHNLGGGEILNGIFAKRLVSRIHVVNTVKCEHGEHLSKLWKQRYEELGCAE
jgi:hypothetical protein